jgi:CheY-like chemotaxis protein
MALKTLPDVILMDIQMPVLGGHEATMLLRERGYKGPIIALSAHAMTEEREKSIEAGCNEHLVKPIDRLGLIEAVHRYGTGQA